jgi:hypothetical protein
MQPCAGMPWPIRVHRSLCGGIDIKPTSQDFSIRTLTYMRVGRQSRKTLSFRHAIDLLKPTGMRAAAAQLWRYLGASQYPLHRTGTVFDSITSYIVILNLIANFPFLYHKSENAR